MKLRLSELENKKQWEDKGVILPQFDIEKMRANTYENPQWLHLGAGNIFRAFPAAVCQQLLNKGIMDTGIIVAEGYDDEIITKSIEKFENLHIAVTLKADGTMDKEIIASISEALCMDRENEKHWARLETIFKKPSLKMVSFTITEKGYQVKGADNEFLPLIAKDIENTPDKAESYMGKLVSLLYIRYLKGACPLTLVSMDNCSHNGTMLSDAVTAIAKAWTDRGVVRAGFYNYVKSDVAYPWSMIDKITPRPSTAVAKILTETGLEEAEPFITSKNTYTACFINAEEIQYLVIEDCFKNGKLPLDQEGVIYTDRGTVDKVEKMKVCTCLNPLQTALAVFGCLLGYTSIPSEMENPKLVSLIEKIGYDEGLKVVVDPGIISPSVFIDEVVNKRLPNPFMPDTPQRIACDTSQKLSIRFGETIKAYMADDKLNAAELEYIPLTIAGWCRYLMGINDQGNTFELSPDPMLDELTRIIGNIEFGKNENVTEVLKQILSNAHIFGIDLYEAGLGEKVERYFCELNQGVDAVEKTLNKYL